jgi:D-glycero-alpha-D-manno-heptose-7-phosphate kinase
VTVTPLQIDNSTLYNLEDRLMMFFTGYSRNASAVLDDQKVRSESGDAAMLENLHYTKQLGQCIKLALEQGNARRFGELMHEHWMHKKDRSPGTTSESINRWYEIGRANGAVGGKLVGAGGGGFLLFYADDRDALRRAMVNEGLREFRFKFDHEGSKLLSRD